MSRKLRLVKVIVQPHFVFEDDEGELTEEIADPVTVPAKGWPDFVETGFATAQDAFEKKLIESQQAEDEPSEEGGT